MKQRIYRNYFWVALTTILIVSFVFVFSYNRTIHDQKEEGMREEAEFISALLEKQGDADIGFQAAAGKTDFRITLIAENGMVLYDNKVKDVSGMENHAKRPEILKASKNGEGSSSRISSTIQSETYYYARKLSDGRYLRLSSKGLERVCTGTSGTYRNRIVCHIYHISDRPFPYQKYRRSDQRH